MLKLRILVASIFSLGLMSLAALPVSAATDTQDAICAGSTLNLEESADTKCSKTNDKAVDKANSLIQDIVNLLSIIVGIVAVIMIIYGGFRYVTSGGDSGNITTAKNVILYAIIGLVIAALAQVIVKFVLAKATS